MYGNINELVDASGSPGKSSLFFLTGYYPGISLPGDRVTQPGKAPYIFEVSGALSSALENTRERFIDISGRTNNRIRSPR